MSLDLILEKYKWFSDKNIFVVGFAWINNTYVTRQDFSDLIKNQPDFKSFKTFTASLNGQFSIIVRNHNETWLSCSHTWSNPIFYRKNKTKYIISDEPEKLINSDSDKKPDSFSSVYFLNFGVTPKNTTLSKNISQIRPGETVCLKALNKVISEVPDFLNFSSDSFPEEVSSIDLQNHLIESFEKYYEQIKGKQVLLPLTKGYDSRLLACLLSEFGHKDVICATWGRKDSSEKHTAQKVAEKLGFKYISVDYNETMVQNFTITEEFRNYVKYVGHWSSMPFFYEYFGLFHLRNKEIINEEVIALPGHPGDFLKGSHLNQNMLNFSADDFGAHIVSHFSTSTPIQKSGKKELSKFIVENYFMENEASLWQRFEQWDLEERQCKFIGNSSMIFSFFGMNYFMPLFDLSTLQFFRKIQINQRVGETLYNKTLENNFFKKYHVDFDLKPAVHGSASKSKLKDVLIRLAPHFLKMHYYPVNDDIFYREITQELRNANTNFEFKHPLRPHFYNSYIAQWYTQYLAGNPC